MIVGRRESTAKRPKVYPGTIDAGGDEESSEFQGEEDDEGYYDEDDVDEDEGYPYAIRVIRRSTRFLSRIFSYDAIVNGLTWLLDIATIRFSIKFDDILYMMAFFVLFANDIKVLCDSPKSVDKGFDVVTVICLFFFVFEWLANTMVKTYIDVCITNNPSCINWLKDIFLNSRISGYMFSFPWLLDVIFIIFICPEISWVQERLNLQPQMLLGPTNSGITERGARLVRVIKAIQLFRVAAERRKRERQDQELMDMVQYGDMDEAELMQYVKTQTLQASRESKLGNQLKESTVRRIILIVYSMFFIVPLLIYYPTDGGPHLSTKVLFNMVSSPSLGALGKQAAVASYEDNLKNAYGSHSLLYLDIYPPVGGLSPLINRADLIETIRPYMQWKVQYETYDATGAVLLYRTKAIIDYTEYYKRSSILTIFLYVFIGVVLAGGFWAITDDVQRLVLAPIERMMNMVDEVSRNPLQKLQFDRTASSGGEYEMSLLESTLEKITSLLRIGFGEAGANIIKTNLNNADGSCTINPLLPGIRIYAILGFCDIHHFEYCTQQLGNDVLTFTNTIAEIVHSNVHSWRGACNKNLGNAFVLLWRIGDEEELLASYGARHVIKRMSDTRLDSSRGVRYQQSTRNSLGSQSSGEVEIRRKKEVDLKRVPDIERWADHALISYLKIIVSINRNKRIMDYRVEPRLTMDGARDFKVRMGFGLHAGWAIEGAVGSLQKVDATYLSPHVNMAARLETSSRQYGVPLLMSQNFYDLLSDEGKELCRRVDRVTVKGSEVPIDIYTYDCLQDQEFKAEKKGRGDMAAKGKGLKMLGLSGDVPGGFDLSSPAFGQDGSGRGGMFSGGFGRESMWGVAVAFTGGKGKEAKGGGAFTPPLGPAGAGAAYQIGSISPKGGPDSSGSSSPLTGAAPNIEDALREVNEKFASRRSSGTTSNMPSVLFGNVHSSTGALGSQNDGDHMDGSGRYEGNLPPSLPPSQMSRPGSARMSGRDLSSASTLLPQFGDASSRMSGKGEAFLSVGNGSGEKGNSAARVTLRPGATGHSARTVGGALQRRPSMANGSISRRPSNANSLLTNFTIETETAIIFERDLDLKQLRAHVTKDFRDQFETGLVHYLTGDWHFAREELEKANQMMKEKVPSLGGDGPSLALLKYMDQYEYVAPQGWMNYRPLTSK